MYIYIYIYICACKLNIIMPCGYGNAIFMYYWNSVVIINNFCSHLAVILCIFMLAQHKTTFR